MGLPALAADYLFIGPLIVARLVDQVPDIAVDLVERADQVLKADQRSKVLMVMWAGDRFNDEARQGASQQVQQRWLAILALNNVGKLAASRSNAAGQLLSQVHLALAGWAPEGSPRPLKRANAPMAPTFTDTKAVFPLGFEVQLTL